MSPRGEKIIDRDVLVGPKEELLRPRPLIKRRLQIVGARNPYAVYRARRHKNPFSDMTPLAAREALYGLGESKLDYSRLFDPRWGSCLFCQKTIDITRVKHVTIEANRDSVVGSEQKSESSSETSPDESLVGGPGNIYDCEQNLGKASWILQNKINSHDPASFIWPWFDYDFDPNYTSYPDKLSPAFDDAFQGPIPDCYLLAALSSMAWYCAVNKKPAKIVTDPGSPISFLTTDNRTISVISSQTVGDVLTDYSLPVDTSQPRSVSVGAKTKTGQASWVPYYEKAFARYLEYTGKIVPPSPDPNHPDICRIPCGDAGETLRALMKKSVGYLKAWNFVGPLGSASRNPEAVWAQLRNNCESPLIEGAGWNAWKTKYPSVAWTCCTGDPVVTGNPYPPLCAAPSGSRVDYVDDLILASHAYSLLGIHKLSATKMYVILRNPYNENWGFIYGKTAYSLSDGPLVFYSIKAGGIQYTRPLFEDHLGSLLPIRGVFALKLEDFVNYFASFNWVVA